MPGYGKAKALRQRSSGELVATLTAFIIGGGLIAIALTATLIRHFALATLLFCGAGLSFTVFWMITGSLSIATELRRRRRAQN